MDHDGLRETEWNILNDETDRLINEINELSPLLPYYTFIVDQKIDRLEEIEAIVNDSISVKLKKSKSALRLL